MKKLLRLFALLALMLLNLPTAMADSDKTTIQEGADITGIKRLAIGMPLYVPAEKGDPVKEELVDIIYKPHGKGRVYVLSYDNVAHEIISATNINIKILDKRKAAQIFVENAPKFSDAYVILTVANNRGIDCFFDVYKSGTNELLYTYQIATGTQAHGQELRTVYKDLAESFYINLDESIKAQIREAKKNENKNKN